MLRFQISFPDTFPSLPPLVTFSTDMFHPLITPLTTYMYTTDIQDGGTVSATDEERLPPGGFSLRHGFPDWFGRAARRSRQVSSPPQAQASVNTPPRPAGETGGAVGLLGSPPGSAASSAASDALASHARRRDISTFEVLRYIRSTFDDEDMLDSVPLEAAGNPGAWHAWRAHRRQVNATSNGPAGISPGAVRGTGTGTGKALPPEPSAVRGGGDRSGGGSTRRPGEWNWEGVWEERVKRGITTSLSEAVLYGNVGAADELVSSLPCFFLFCIGMLTAID